MVCTHHKGFLKAVVSKKIKLKKGESVFQRNKYLLCIKWCDKRPVCMLSSCHSAKESKVKKQLLGTTSYQTSNKTGIQENKWTNF